MSKSRQLNDDIYVVKSNLTIVDGKFISKGTQWIYILFKTGNVVGCVEENLFDNREKALEHLIEKLREKLITGKK